MLGWPLVARFKIGTTTACQDRKNCAPPLRLRVSLWVTRASSALADGSPYIEQIGARSYTR